MKSSIGGLNQQWKYSNNINTYLSNNDPECIYLCLFFYVIALK